MKYTIEKKQKYEEFNVTFRGFWGRLFCIHKYKKMGVLNQYGNNDKYPRHSYWRFICTECGKINMYKKF